MKIIFVGIHNKPDMKALDSRTKSGKIVDRIISELAGHECSKANLYNIDRLPNATEKYLLKTEFMSEYLMNFQSGTDEALYILLGNMVHREFPKHYSKIIKLAHPASSCYVGMKDQEYINRSILKIKNILK